MLVEILGNIYLIFFFLPSGLRCVQMFTVHLNASYGYYAWEEINYLFILIDWEQEIKNNKCKSLNGIF